MTCAIIAVCKSYIVTDPETTAELVAGIVSVPKFNKLTVFNETDQPVQIDYKDTGGNASVVIVPPARTFTRIMNNDLNPASVYCKSVTTNATGKVYLILGN
jgi:hypothetical protein